MIKRYHPYDPADPKPATMYPADEGAYVKWEDFVEIKSERDQANLRWYEEHMRLWKEVVSTDVYQDLKHGKFRDILNLLADGEVSVGKAAQSIVERAGGIEPRLPAQTFDSDLSWKERYDKLKAEFDENLKITG